eukprot:jgi/Bigna1/130260/aug1.10_g4968
MRLKLSIESLKRLEIEIKKTKIRRESRMESKSRFVPSKISRVSKNSRDDSRSMPSVNDQNQKRNSSGQRGGDGIPVGSGIVKANNAEEKGELQREGSSETSTPNKLKLRTMNAPGSRIGESPIMSTISPMPSPRLGTHSDASPLAQGRKIIESQEGEEE